MATVFSERLMPNPETQLMSCMEVWGGNTQTQNAVSISGLDAWIYSKPFASSTAGGDVYYLSSCATGRITRLLLADVSGHGSSVADTASTLQSLMRRYVNHIEQKTFVRSMNHHFTQLSAAGTFATAVVATFFGPTNALTLSNAGHPSPLLYRAKTKTWSLLQTSVSPTNEISDIPLGIDDVANYQELALQLDPADLVLCYSDSLIESHHPSGELLGEQDLLQLVNTFQNPDPTNFISQLLEKIAALHPDNLTEDDVTLFLFRPNHTRPKPSFFVRAFAPFRVTFATLRSLLPGQPPPPLPELSAANLLGIHRQK